MNESRFDPKKFATYKFRSQESFASVIKGEKNTSPRGKEKRTWRFSDPMIIIIVSVVAAFIIRTFIFQLFYVPSNSMDPAINAGDRILVNKLSYGIPNPLWGVKDTEKILYTVPNPLFNRNISLSNKRYLVRFGKGPQRMDVIAFKHRLAPGYFIKRIIGLPGEQVKIRKGTVYINGKPLKEMPSLIKDMTDYGPVKVGLSSYFVLGDNRADSSDSRQWGPIGYENVIGSSIIRVWPLKNIRMIR